MAKKLSGTSSKLTLPDGAQIAVSEWQITPPLPGTSTDGGSTGLVEASGTLEARLDSPKPVTERELITKVRCTLSEWLTHGPEIVLRYPITTVELEDVPPPIRLRADRFVYFVADVDTDTDYLPTKLAFYFREPLHSGKLPADPAFYFHSPQEGISALSYACVAYARDTAGLPPLPDQPA